MQPNTNPFTAKSILWRVIISILILGTLAGPGAQMFRLLINQ